MAAKNPNPGATTKVLGSPSKVDAPRISYDDAELAASRIRPSWELFDEGMRDDVAADLLGAPAAPHDTIVDGVAPLPSVATPEAAKDESAPVAIDGMPAPLADKRSRPVSKTYVGLGGETIPAAAIAAARAGDKVSVTSNDDASSAPAKAAPSATITDAEPLESLATGAEVPSSSDVKKSVDETPAKKVEEPDPVSKRSAEAAPSSKGSAPKSQGARAKASTSAAPAKSETAPESRRRVAKADVAPHSEDDIKIPVTGASSATLVKIGLGLAAAVAIGVIGYGVMGGGKSTSPTAATTPTQQAAPPAPTLAAAPPPTTTTTVVATATPPPTVAPVAPSVTAAATVAVATAKPADPKPDRPKSDSGKKTSAPPPPPTVKKGGGIIRETPF